MKQMNKEEIIEYFIEQLGDNEILGKIMTIEQIREKLNNIINNITYDSDLAERGGYDGAWYTIDRIINFKSSNIATKTIVHEVLHALSQVYSIILCNRAIDEGMTEYLAEKITGQKSDIYSNERAVYKIISTIIGEQVMLNHYFNGDMFSYKEYDFIKYDLIGKYGIELGVEINDNIRKVLGLADKLNNLNSEERRNEISEYGKKIKEEISNELGDALTLIIKKYITNMQDFIEIYKYISTLNLPSIKIENLVYDMSEVLDEQALVEILKNSKYMGRYTVYSICNILFDKYIKNVKISEDKCLKRALFKHLIEKSKDIDTVAALDSKLAKLKYRQVGDFYEIWGIDGCIKGNLYTLDYDRESMTYSSGIPRDKDGTYWMEYGIINANEIWLPTELPREIGIAKEKLVSILLEKQKKLNEKRKDSQETSQDFSKYKEITLHYSVNARRLTLSYDGGTDIYCEFYSMNSDGILEEMKCGEERGFLDDMTELDIKLQEQTADVSMTEIVQEADNIKRQLNEKENTQIKQNQIGE